MPQKSAIPTTVDKIEAYTTRIERAESDDADRVSTDKFTSPVSRFACK
jgi:hypothetical protein